MGLTLEDPVLETLSLEDVGPVCHVIDSDTRATLCGAAVTGLVPPHTERECLQARHPRCVVCHEMWDGVS